jgi:E3 ubiquitin-protein ligase UBR7
VLEAEETYAPPSDPQASVRDDDAASVTSSTYDLGMAALRAMPREKMINSLHAYSKFRDALWEHLKPFAGTGKMVREEDVRAFFQNTLNSNK